MFDVGQPTYWYHRTKVMMSGCRRDCYVPDIGDPRYTSRYTREYDPPYIEALDEKLCTRRRVYLPHTAVKGDHLFAVQPADMEGPRPLLDDPDLTLSDALINHPHSLKSRWQPGTYMSYCNMGPVVAAYIVEKVTGQSFEAYVDENIFNPLEMNTASFFF